MVVLLEALLAAAPAGLHLVAAIARTQPILRVPDPSEASHALALLSAAEARSSVRIPLRLNFELFDLIRYIHSVHQDVLSTLLDDPLD